MKSSKLAEIAKWREGDMVLTSCVCAYFCIDNPRRQCAGRTASCSISGTSRQRRTSSVSTERKTYLLRYDQREDEWTSQSGMAQCRQLQHCQLFFIHGLLG